MIDSQPSVFSPDRFDLPQEAFRFSLQDNCLVRRWRGWPFRLVVAAIVVIWSILLAGSHVSGQTYTAWDPSRPSLHLVTGVPSSPNAKWRTFVHLQYDFGQPQTVARLTTRTVPTRAYILPTVSTPQPITMPAVIGSDKPVVSTALPSWFVATKVQSASTAMTTGYTSIPTTTVVTTQELIRLPEQRFRYGVSFVRCR